jgi:hypothetical protein
MNALYHLLRIRSNLNYRVNFCLRIPIAVMPVSGIISDRPLSASPCELLLRLVHYIVVVSYMIGLLDDAAHKHLLSDESNQDDSKPQCELEESANISH